MSSLNYKNNEQDVHIGPHLRAPAMEDGPLLHELALAAGGLDVNSAYAYLLHGLHHASCCVLAKMSNEPAGFLTGYRVPSQSDWDNNTLGERIFIWQMAVHPDHRGHGLARAMVNALISRHENRQVHYLDFTTTSSNKAALRVFTSLAGQLGTTIGPICTIGAHLLPRGHEPETLYRVGPFIPPMSTEKNT